MNVVDYRHYNIHILTFNVTRISYESYISTGNRINISLMFTTALGYIISSHSWTYQITKSLAALTSKYCNI